MKSLLIFTGDDVYRKIVNLRSQFRREKHREAKLISEGRAEEAPYQIKWIHYQQLKFLDKFVTLRLNPADVMQYSPGVSPIVCFLMSFFISFYITMIDL